MNKYQMMQVKIHSVFNLNVKKSFGYPEFNCTPIALKTLRQRAKRHAQRDRDDTIKAMEMAVLADTEII